MSKKRFGRTAPVVLDEIGSYLVSGEEDAPNVRTYLGIQHDKGYASAAQPRSCSTETYH